MNFIDLKQSSPPFYLIFVALTICNYFYKHHYIRRDHVPECANPPPRAANVVRTRTLYIRDYLYT